MEGNEKILNVENDSPFDNIKLEDKQEIIDSELEDTKLSSKFADLVDDDLVDENDGIYENGIDDDVEIISADTVEDNLSEKMTNDLLKSFGGLEDTNQTDNTYDYSTVKSHFDLEDFDKTEEINKNNNSSKEDSLDEDDSLNGAEELYNDDFLEKLRKEIEDSDKSNSVVSSNSSSNKSEKQFPKEDAQLDNLLKKFREKSGITTNSEKIDSNISNIMQDSTLSAQQKDEKLAQNYVNNLNYKDKQQLSKFENKKDSIENADNVKSQDEFDFSQIQQVTGKHTKEINSIFPFIKKQQNKQNKSKPLLSNKSKPYFIFLMVLVVLVLGLGAILALQIFDVIDLNELFK